LLTASDDGEIYKWDPATGKSLGSMYMKAPSVGIGTSYVTGPVTLSPDGTRALSGEGFGGSGVYDTATGSQLFALPGYGGNTRAGFTPDGTRIIQALTSFDPNKAPSRVLVWDVATTRKLGEVALPGVAYPAAAVSPDGKSLITAGLKQKADGKLGDFLVTGWELATGKKLGEYKEPGGYETIYLVAAGDNKSVVATSPKFDGKLMVVDFVAGTRARDFDLERSRPVAAPAVSPDGKLVAIPLAPDFGPRGTATVAICDIETGKVKKKVSGVSGMPTLVLFSADGKTLVTGSQDTTVLLWDISGM
jgi:WD40 repeat protein